MTRRQLLASSTATLAAPAIQAQPRRRNIVFILSDDHRYDFLGCLGHPWLAGYTPNLDRMFTQGAHFRNAFVTSSLCSPSRASILTGLYMHAHKVRDNFTPLDNALPTFPRTLRENGYKTGFVGKWHMGGASDEQRPGFDRWVSFFGQGEYTDPKMNIDGQRSQVKGNITDVLTNEAKRFIGDAGGQPFCLYLSHKAVHFPFQAPPKHAGLFHDKKVPWPKSIGYREEWYAQLPEWVRKRRYTRHGVDGAFGQPGPIDDWYRGYCQSLIGIDDSVGQVMAELEDRHLLNDTLVVYMGDNGYMWGEHGLLDKRAMYEPSMRVPLAMHCPDMFAAGTKVDAMSLNIDLASTFLDTGGVRKSPPTHGRSLLPLLSGRKPDDWRTDFLYNYEWEPDYPYTPTIWGLRTETQSFMQHWGVWDISELYDLVKDPDQMTNQLASARVTYGRGRQTYQIQDEALKARVVGLQERMATILRTTGGDPRFAAKSDPNDVYAL
ncbi:MAG: sulfatase [Acidobacteriota bacterium]